MNNIPLPERAIRRILDTVLPLGFDRLYSAFGELPADARAIVERSLRRYMSWVRGDQPESLTPIDRTVDVREGPKTEDGR